MSGDEPAPVLEIKDVVVEKLPAQMKAVVYEKYTPEEEWKDVLLVDEKKDVPGVTPGHVLIRVHAAGMNQIDWKMAKGNLSIAMSKPPIVPGYDVSGTVVRLGPNVKRIKLGDAVYARSRLRLLGAFAEYVLLPEDVVALKPASLTFAEAASLPTAALAAHEALVVCGLLKKGSRVLVLGGSGGVGSMAIQLARQLGAGFVTCTCSKRNFDYVRALGATDPIDYHTQNWWEELHNQDIDIIVDTVGGYSQWQHAATVLRPKLGRFVTLCGDDLVSDKAVSVGTVGKTTGQVLNRKFWSLFGYSNYHIVNTRSGWEKLELVRELIQDGGQPGEDGAPPRPWFRSFVERVYAFELEDVVKMFEHSRSGHTQGRVCLAVSPHANKKLYLSNDA